MQKPPSSVSEITSENTLKFIQERLGIISSELGAEESKAKGFKQANQLVAN